MTILSNYDGNALFIRRYRVLVSSGGNSGLDVSQLRCTFDIEKSMSETPNFSEISIYNLSAQTENIVIKSGSRLVLEAGYEGEQYGLIFDGDIVQTLRDKEDGTTYKLTLLSQDGDKFLNSGIVNASFRAGQNSRSIISEIANKATNSVELHTISDNLENTTLPRGKVIFGLGRDYLHQIARSEQAAFYVNDGKVNIVKANDLPQGRIIDLSPTSGLIGTPEQVDDGIKAKCLLNPLLNLNSFVHINNKHVRMQKAGRDSLPKQLDYDGVYRVIKINHIGDSRGDSWYTEFVGISQSGSIPDTGESMR